MKVPLRMLCLAAGFAPTLTATGQSTGAVRFFGTGEMQRDRVRISIDDNLPGANSQPCDVGGGSFSIDFWIRGRLVDNPSGGPTAGDAEYFDFRWIDGHIVIDRDIWGASSRDWGVSLAAGLVRFGTGRADQSPLDQEHTSEGSVNVLDDTWRHIACVRDAATGVKSIYVDGALDYATPPGRSRDNISYPDAGDPAPNTPWGPYIVLAAEKHDAGSAYPSFDGYLDEVRIWSRALSSADVLAVYNRVLTAGQTEATGLVGYFRFEESTGSFVGDASGSGQSPGELIANTPGNGLRVFAAQNPDAVAPVESGPACRADLNNSGTLTVQDIFDFLAMYFATSAGADFNLSGSVTVQDIFDFLAAYFQGCD